jgi:hypothetical protein
MEITTEKNNSYQQGKTVYSQARKQALCEAWQTSGLSYAEFSRQHAIPRSTFAAWCRSRIEKRDKASKENTVSQSNKTASESEWVPLSLDALSDGASESTMQRKGECEETATCTQHKIHVKLCRGIEVQIQLALAECITLCQELAHGLVEG